MITVKTLRVAPVKGLGSLTRPEVYLETGGVAEDRRLFLLRADNSVVTLRRYPQLGRVVPDLDLSAGTLTVRLPDGTTGRSDVADAADPVRAHLFGKDRTGHVLPGAVAEALSDFLGEPVRVVWASGTGVGWDEGPVSLISRASTATVETPADDGVGAARYRMLVEVDGCEPYAEDAWIGQRWRLGGAEIAISHALDRCVVINASPVTGTVDWPGLKTLAAVRGPRQLTLGVIATVVRPGPVSLGDPVTPIDRAVAPLDGLGVER